MPPPGRRTVEQAALLDDVAARFNDLLREPGPLWDVCPCGSHCWDGQRRPKQMEARLPWIGRAYPNHRVAVVGMNTRDDGAQDAELRTTLEVAAKLSEGERHFGGGLFHFHAASVAWAILQSLSGRTPDGPPAPQDAADALQASARLQAVQCSPCNTPRRTPNSAMWQNCPPFLLSEQLNIIQPRVMALLGTGTMKAIRLLPCAQVEWSTSFSQTDRCFARGHAEIGNRTIVLFALLHPAAARWVRSWTALLTNLRDDPLG